MESIPIAPLSHTKTNAYMLTSKEKRKCLQFFRAKSELLDDLSDDIELWELLMAELNKGENQIHTKTEYSNAIQVWKSSITSTRPFDSSYAEEDQQLRQIMYRLNEQMVGPTENQLKCVIRCFKINFEENILWSRIAARLNMLSNTRYSIPLWQQTFRQFTKQLVAKKNLSQYLTNKYSKSPLSLTKIEQCFLKECADRIGPCIDNLFSCCRICLASDISEMIYIFDHGSPNDAEASMLDKLAVSGCFDVEPQLDDNNLPQFICKSCSLLVESAYQLRILCLKNEEKLREIANRKKQFMDGLFDSENHDDEMEIDYTEEPIVMTLDIKSNDCVRESAPEQLLQQNQKQTKNLLCEECGKSFSKIGQLKHHSISHGSIRAHICTICNKSFKQISSLKNHQAVHKKIKDFKCTMHKECAFATNTIYNLRVHERTHRDVQAYSCSYCEMKFKTASNQLKHMRGVHQKQRSLKCDQCECTYFNRESLRRHTVVHTGQRPFDCAADGCNQNYLWYSGLRKHMLQFHAKDNVAVPTEKYYLDKFFDSLPQKVIKNNENYTIK